MMSSPQHHPAIKAQRAAEIRLMQRLLAAGWCRNPNGIWFAPDTYDDHDGWTLYQATRLLSGQEKTA